MSIRKRGTIRLGRGAPQIYDEDAGYPAISIQTPAPSVRFEFNRQTVNITEINERSRITPIDPHTAAEYSAYRAAHFFSFQNGS